MRQVSYRPPVCPPLLLRTLRRVTRVRIRSRRYRMKERGATMQLFGKLAVIGIASLSLGALSGCDREVSRYEEVDVDEDGTVETKEKTVTENRDGSKTVTEEETKTEP